MCGVFDWKRNGAGFLYCLFISALSVEIQLLRGERLYTIADLIPPHIGGMYDNPCLKLSFHI